MRAHIFVTDTPDNSPRSTKKSSSPNPSDLAMRQVLSVNPKKGLPSWSQWKHFSSVLSLHEKRWFVGSLLLMILCATYIVGWYVHTHQVEIPAVGGSYTEGLLGQPQFVNPLYATTGTADADLTALVYSGLVAYHPEQGLVNDLAESISVSEDAKTYTVTLRENAHFHNGEPVRARDVVFTYTAVQNPSYRSPHAVSYTDVSITQVDDRTVAFELSEPFASFLDTLTLGILPADIWGSVDPRNAPLAAFNLEPIGAGPYVFDSFTKDKKGAIRSYTLTRNPDYYRTPAFIEELTFKFYADAHEAADALNNRNIEGLSYVPFDQLEMVSEDRTIQLIQPRLPRQTILFFNEDAQAQLGAREIREAMTLAIDKNAIIEHALGDQVVITHGPLLSGDPGYREDLATQSFDYIRANEVLEEAGYSRKDNAVFRSAEDGASDESPSDEEETEETSDDTSEPPTHLRFVLQTIDSTEFTRSADLIAEQLRQIGIELLIETTPADRFFTEVVEPRAYELLLTSVLLGADGDPYALWHSSQTESGGLNLAGFKNARVDELLEQARTSTSLDERAKAYEEFYSLVLESYAAVFLYQSTYSYAPSAKIEQIHLDEIRVPSDRFSTITSWYTRTRKALR